MYPGDSANPGLCQGNSRLRESIEDPEEESITAVQASSYILTNVPFVLEEAWKKQ